MTREPSMHRGQEIEIVLQNEAGDAVYAFLTDEGRIVVVVNHDGSEQRLEFGPAKG